MVETLEASGLILTQGFQQPISPSTCIVAPYFEDFDAGIGTTLNNGWIWDAGGTPSVNTGPSDDMTGGGYYMYYETSTGYLDTVSLFTECLDISGLSNPCLEFAYHMYGATMGIFNVDVSVLLYFVFVIF